MHRLPCECWIGLHAPSPALAIVCLCAVDPNWDPAQCTVQAHTTDPAAWAPKSATVTHDYPCARCGRRVVVWRERAHDSAGGGCVLNKPIIDQAIEMLADLKDDAGPKLRCDFCEKPQNEVKSLIAGAHTNICDECVEMCAAILEEEARRAQEMPTQPRVPLVCPRCGGTKWAGGTDLDPEPWCASGGCGAKQGEARAVAETRKKAGP